MITPHWEVDSDRHITWWHACTGHPGFDEVPAGIPIGDDGWKALRARFGTHANLR